MRFLLSALHRLSRLDAVRVRKVSPVYLSEAHTADDRPQADYLNAVVQIETALAPPALLTCCLDIERSLGRQRDVGGRWRPRTIDLDVLLHPSGGYESEDLHLPHPRMTERLFVLLPLQDLTSPQHHVPELGASLGDIVLRCPDSGRILRTVVELGNYK